MTIKGKESFASWGFLRRFLFVAGILYFIAILLALNNFIYNRSMGRPISLHDAAWWPFFYYSVWILLTGLILVFTMRLQRAKIGLWPRLAAHAMFSLVIIALYVAACVPFRQVPVNDLWNEPRFTWHFFRTFYLQGAQWNLWMYSFIVGLSYGIEYYFSAREGRVRAADLEYHLARAELQVLKNQLQPHFLFNTLNSISALMYKNVDAADDMIGDLSALLRLGLESTGTQEVALRNELDSLKLYVNIQRIRFQDRLTVEMNIAPESLDAYVPHLILQPIVENAIRHGVSKRADAGVVTITSNVDDGRLRLRVSDNGPGRAADAEHKEGIGLKNTRARLQKLYHYHALNIESSEKGFTVEMEFPIMRADASAIKTEAGERWQPES